MLPKISIVTPSYNQGQFLEKTILSIINQNYPNLEYIIIDGGSTDNSVDIIKKYENKITYWVSEPDKGQSHAINKGISHSRGEIFNWINSDDWLEPGALQNIAKTWGKNPNAAAWVGACRRVDINGNELNVIFPNNLSRSNMGENWNGRQFYQPACFMNTTFIQEIGGIDESLNFCMDLDLWLKIAKKKFFVCGEGIWANATIHSNAKTQQDRQGMHLETVKTMSRHGFQAGAKNRYENTFKKKPGKYIPPDDLHSNPQGATIAYNNYGYGQNLKVTMISDYMPRYDASSSQHRVSHIIKILAKAKFSIDYLYFVRDHQDPEYAAAHNGNILFHFLPFDPHIYLKKIISSQPDILWVTNIWTVNYLHSLIPLLTNIRQKLPKTKIIIDTMDYHAKKFFRKYKVSKKIEDLLTAQEFSKGEQALYPIADDIITVTNEEKRDIQKNISDCPPVTIIPNIHEIHPPQNNFHSRSGIVFLGNFAVTHNYDAAEYFITHIWPHIVSRSPDVHFHVVGRKAETKLAHFDHKSIILHGYTKDIKKLFDKFRVFVCPMTYGAGMKGKIGTAISFGLPIVSTSIGTEGFPLKDGQDLFISNDPEEFALKCLHLHEDPICWNNFSLNSQKKLAALCGTNSVAVTLKDLLNAHYT